MHLLLLVVFVVSVASMGVAVGALFLAIRDAKRDDDNPMREPAPTVSSVPRRGGTTYSTEETVPSIQSRQPEWDSQ